MKTMTQSIEKILEEINGFTLDLDSEYYSDFVQIVLGKIRALSSHLKARGFLDLVSEIDESEPDEDNIIRVLESLRGYVIPETYQRLQREEANSSYRTGISTRFAEDRRGKNTRRTK